MLALGCGDLYDHVYVSACNQAANDGWWLHHWAEQKYRPDTKIIKTAFAFICIIVVVTTGINKSHTVSKVSVAETLQSLLLCGHVSGWLWAFAMLYNNALQRYICEYKSEKVNVIKCSMGATNTPFYFDLRFNLCEVVEMKHIAEEPLFMSAYDIQMHGVGNTTVGFVFLGDVCVFAKPASSVFPMSLCGRQWWPKIHDSFR